MRLFYARLVAGDYRARADRVEDVNRGFNGGENAMDFIKAAREANDDQ